MTVVLQNPQAPVRAQDLASFSEAVKTKRQSAISVETAARLADAVASAQYDSNTKRINFYNGETTPQIISYIDATPFIVDGMLDSVSIQNGNLVFVFNTDAGKQNISIPLTDIFNPDNYYTKTQVDNLLSQKEKKSILLTELMNEKPNVNWQYTINENEFTTAQCTVAEFLAWAAQGGSTLTISDWWHFYRDHEGENIIIGGNDTIGAIGYGSFNLVGVNGEEGYPTFIFERFYLDTQRETLYISFGGNSNDSTVTFTKYIETIEGMPSADLTAIINAL